MKNMKEIKDIILCGDAAEELKNLPDGSIDMCVTSPPYFGLRNYDVVGQIGQEKSPDEYIARLLDVFSEVHRVLKPEGTLWLNIGDAYAGSGQGAGTKNPSEKQKSNRGMTHMQVDGFKSKLLTVQDCKRKDMIGIPWKLAFALRDAGWVLRQDIIWYKPNVMPESVKDRCTKSYEHIFLLAKNEKYYFNSAAIREPCSEFSLADFKRRKTLTNKGGGQESYEGVRPDLCRSRADYYSNDGKRYARDVWEINTKPYKGAHFATFPEELASRCISAGCPENGIVLDPFMGAGTTAITALKQGKHYIGIELNHNYISMAEERIRNVAQNIERKGANE